MGNLLVQILGRVKSSLHIVFFFLSRSLVKFNFVSEIGWKCKNCTHIILLVLIFRESDDSSVLSQIGCEILWKGKRRIFPVLKYRKHIPFLFYTLVPT